MNNTRKTKNSIFAIPALSAAKPPNPKTPAITATTKNINAQFNNMLLSYFLTINLQPK